MFSPTDQLIECVPNFSEGRNQQTIDAIAAAIRNVAGVKLMHIDVGVDANRTVYTFAGFPQAVAEAAYQAIKVAAERIDMSRHKGEHPRMGACDVCPLIPLQHISMDEVADISKQLGKRIGDSEFPVFLYEYSATTPERKNLAYLRKGEYEGIADKMVLKEWIPDFGPATFNERFGMMALGARNFLVAYNINLKTKDAEPARQIAKTIREIRAKTDGSYRSNLFQHVKAIGWFMETFECAQVSTNITDINASPVIEVFTEIKKMANSLGIETNGSELIGLVPVRALQHPEMTVEQVIEYLGLNTLKTFTQKENIIEYNLNLEQ